MSGGVVSLGCLATSRGRAVVIKLSPRASGGERLRTEGEALSFRRSTGAAATLQDRRDDGYTLLLAALEALERARRRLRQSYGGERSAETLAGDSAACRSSC